MTAPVVPALPDAPSLTTGASEFAERADQFLGALPQFGAKLNELGTYVKTRADGADAAKTSAANSKAGADASASAAASHANAAATQRQQAEIAAAAARSSAGLPALAGEAGKRLVVNPAANGVMWRASSATIVTLDESGWFVKDPDDLFYLVEAWGGGGGGAANRGGYAGGGSGGEYLAMWVRAADVATAVYVTIGTGGSGAAAATTASGQRGGDTTFGTLLTALGGNPGVTGGSYATAPRSRSPTAPSNAPLPYIPHDTGYGSYGSAQGGDAVNGGGGGGGAYASSQEYLGGLSQRAGKGGAGSKGYNVAGGAGTAPAGGGGGAGYRGAGGAGGAGRVRITRYKL